MKKSETKLLVLGMLLSGYCGATFAGTTISFYAKDQHGSIAGLTNVTGNLTNAALNQYNDYGLNQSNASDNHDQISIHYDPYQYNSEYTDEESGLQPLGNGYRYYDPSLMRFISPDSYPLLNLYAYVNGNPIMDVDPTGHVGEGIGEGLDFLAGGVLDFLFDGVGGDELLVEGAIQMGEAAEEGATDSVAEEATQGTKRLLEDPEEPPAKAARVEAPQPAPSTFRMLPAEVNERIANFLGPDERGSLLAASQDTRDYFSDIFNTLDRPILREDARIAEEEQDAIANLQINVFGNITDEQWQAYRELYNTADLSTDTTAQQFNELGENIRAAYQDAIPDASFSQELGDLPNLIRQACPADMAGHADMLDYSVYSNMQRNFSLGNEPFPGAEDLADFNDAYERVGGSGIEPDPEGSDVSDDDGDGNDL